MKRSINWLFVFIPIIPNKLQSWKSTEISPAMPAQSYQRHFFPAVPKL
jgi:hypothetical protein